MMVAAVCLLLGLTFVEQEIPGLHVEGISLTGDALLNGRQADVNGDGALDLVLAHQVFLQKDGTFDTASPVSGPASDGTCDVWNDRLFLRLPDGLRVVSLKGGAWETELDQALVWPYSLGKSSDGLRFERFLGDIDSDGTPELIVPGEKALHIFLRQGKQYREAGALDVFPVLHLARSVPQTLWPAEDRRVVMPSRTMTCRYTLEVNRLTVLSSEEVAADSIQYRSFSYLLNKTEEGNVTATLTNSFLTNPIPMYMEPCRLNDDDVLDLVGDDCHLSEATALPVPIMNTCASTDGGRTLQNILTSSFRPQCSWVDFDSDGRVDMLTESTGLFEGGIRESVNRFFTSNDFFHEVHVHLQTAEGIFASTPDMTARLQIVLDAPPQKNSEMRRSYQSGRILNATGDFNADRRRDIAVHDRPDRVAVFLSAHDGISREPAFVVPIAPGERFSVADINGDGYSDLVIQWYESTKNSRLPRNRVCFTRKAAP